MDGARICAREEKKRRKKKKKKKKKREREREGPSDLCEKIVELVSLIADGLNRTIQLGHFILFLFHALVHHLKHRVRSLLSFYVKKSKTSLLLKSEGFQLIIHT